MTYDAFISYSHSADDLLAPRLQAGLQKFAKPWWKRRAVRIFRDEASLAANPHLWSSITEALDTSGWFILLLSPDAATSEWVNKEIDHWRSNNDVARILPVVTDGEFAWDGSDVAGSSVPDALRSAFSEEPRWVDMRAMRGNDTLDLKNPTFSAAIADIAATIRGVPKDELASEEVRQHRRTIRTAWAAGVVVLLLGIAASIGASVAVNQSNEAQTQRDEAQRLAASEADARADAEASAEEATRQADIAQAERDTANTERDRADEQTALALAAAEEADLATIISRSAALSAENPEVSILLALEAHRRDPKAETEQAVLNALGRSSIPNRISSLPALNEATDACAAHSIASNGLTQFGILDGVLVTRDPLTGSITEHGAAPIDCGRWIGDEHSGRRIAVSDGLIVAGRFDGAWETERQFDEPIFLMSRSVPESNLLLFIAFPDDTASVRVLDATTLQQVGPTYQAGDEILNVAPNGDGSLIALGWAIHGGPEGDGHTVVHDARTGEQLWQVTTDFPAAEMFFDDAAGHLIAGLWDGSILTIDLTTGEVLSDIESSATSRLLDLGIQEDGLVVVATDGHIELVDRFSGPTGTIVELVNKDNAFIRTDDSVLLLSPDNEVDVINLSGNALIERSFSVDPFANVTIVPGWASDTQLAGDFHSQVTNLTTGEQTSVELLRSDGSVYRAVNVWPQADSLWALGVEREPAVITRWQDGTLVESIDIGLGPVFGGTSGEQIAFVGPNPDGVVQAKLVSIEPGNSGIKFTVDAPENSAVFPALDGGLYILDHDVVVHRFDASGASVGEIAAFPDKAPGIWVGALTVDSANEKLAIATAAGVLVVDTETEQTELLADLRNVWNLSFVRGGELLVVAEGDGTVRMWDLRAGVSAGLVWEGSGGSRSDGPWYDETTETVWVATSGLLIQVPLDPQRWVERACEVVGRNLTQDEWDRHVPGGGEVVPGCPQFVIVDETEPATQGDDGGETITVEGEVDFGTGTGTFTVTAGSDVLGCESGSQDEMDGAAGVEKTLTCESGTRAGTFMITFVPPGGTWEVTGATGDFEGLAGGGEWSGEVSADGGTGIDSWSGNITFTDG